jgi:hypothetical protein
VKRREKEKEKRDNKKVILCVFVVARKIKIVFIRKKITNKRGIIPFVKLNK